MVVRKRRRRKNEADVRKLRHAPSVRPAHKLDRSNYFLLLLALDSYPLLASSQAKELQAFLLIIYYGTYSYSFLVVSCKNEPWV